MLKKKLLAFVCLIIMLTVLSSCSAVLNAALAGAADTKLYTAICSGNLAAAKEAVSDGADINKTTASCSSVISAGDNNTISYCTVSNDCDDIAIYLLENGADANYHKDASLLMSEISIGRYDVCKSLIENGADVNYSFDYDDYKITAVNFLFKDGVTENAAEIIDLLVDSGFADTNHMVNKMLSSKVGKEYNYFMQIEVLDESAYLVNRLYEKQGEKLGISKLMYSVLNGNSDSALDIITNEEITDNIDSLMLYACAFCDESVIGALIDKGADVKNQAISGYNLLEVAAAYNDTDVVEFLKSRNLQFPSVAAEVNAALLNVNHKDMLDYALKNAGDFDLSKMQEEQSILYFAEKYDRADFFEKISSHLGELESYEYEFYLGQAANDNFVDILEVFAENGYTSLFREVLEMTDCNMDTYEFLYETAKGYAAISNETMCGAAMLSRLDRIEFLIENDFDINAKDSLYGNTALYYAIESGNYEITEYLLDNGADLTVTNNDGETPLTYAVNAHSHNIVKLLIDKGADINTANSSGNTPLALAQSCSICCEDKEMLDCLKG